MEKLKWPIRTYQNTQGNIGNPSGQKLAPERPRNSFTCAADTWGKAGRLLFFPKTPSGTLGTLDKLTKKIKIEGNIGKIIAAHIIIFALEQSGSNNLLLLLFLLLHLLSSEGGKWPDMTAGCPDQLDCTTMCAYAGHHELPCLRLIPVISQLKCLHTLMYQRCVAVR